MKISIRYKTIPKMIDICKKHKASKLDRVELESLLEHEDYKVEFDRYNNIGGPRGGFTKEEYIDFFMNFFKLNFKEIKNERLKLRYEDLKYFFDNLDFYESQLEKIYDLDEKYVLEALEYTFKGLPESVKFESLDFIFSVGLGNSGGWFYNSCSHFDIIQYLKNFDLENIKHIIAHEIHHVGFNMFVDKLGIEENLPNEEILFLFLAFEGLAVKYCNNGEGILTKGIYENETKNIGLDKVTWNYLNSNFNSIFDEFKSQLDKIKKNEIDVNECISQYWFSLYTSEQNKLELPKLKHSRNYSLGNDLWGVIHDVYGKDKVFEVIQNLSKFPEVLNSALIEIGKGNLKI